MRAQPLVAVANVATSRAFYKQLLGARALTDEMSSDHDHVYDRLYAGDTLVLQLHVWDEEDHPNLVRAPDLRPGHGVLVWFEVDDFDAAVGRASALGAEILREPHVNPGPRHRELWLRDPDGYVVVVAGPDGSA